MFKFLFVYPAFIWTTKNRQWIQLYKRRFIKILSSYYVCLLIDVVLLYIFSDQVVDIKDIILMVFCKGTIAGLGHLWFVGTILFCYLLTPILSQVYEFQNHKNFKIEFSHLRVLVYCCSNTSATI